MTDLVVWRDGREVGSLTETRGRMTFTYADASQRMVSVAMPTRTQGVASPGRPASPASC